MITLVWSQIFRENLNNICILFQCILTLCDDHKYHIRNYLTCFLIIHLEYNLSPNPHQFGVKIGLFFGF